MATVTTSSSPTGMIRPFSEPMDVNRAYSAAPIGEITFYTGTISIAAAGATDNQRLTVDFNFPTNYAYALTRMSMFIQNTNNTVNFGDQVYCFLLDTLLAADATLFEAFGLTSEGVAVTPTWYKQYRPLNFPDKYLFRSKPGDQARVALELYNATANDTAMSAFAYLRALVYSVNQDYGSIVNSPVLVR